MSFAARMMLVLVCYAICVGGVVAVAIEHSDPRLLPYKPIPVRYNHEVERVWLRV